MASYVKSAAEGVESGAKSTAEAVRPYVGDYIADTVKQGGEYGKAGVEKAGEVIGFKEGAGQASADSAKANLTGAGEQLKAAAKDTQGAFGEAGHNAHVSAHANKEGAKAEAQSTYDSAVQNTKSAYESAKQTTADALHKGADQLQGTSQSK